MARSCFCYLSQPCSRVRASTLAVILYTDVLKVLVGIKLWKNRSSFRSIRIQGWKSVQLLARLGAFHVYSLLVLA